MPFGWIISMADRLSLHVHFVQSQFTASLHNMKAMQHRQAQYYLLYTSYLRLFIIISILYVKAVDRCFVVSAVFSFNPVMKYPNN